MKLHFKLRQLLFLGRILIYTKKKVSKLLAWYVQDTWNRPDHVFWRNDKQQNYGRDSNYGKRKSIHILLTFDSFLSPLWLFFGTVFVQKNSRNSMSRHTPIHCILTNNNFRSFPSLNRRNFYWTLQAALEPKPRLIAVLGTKYSRGSHWRNSVRLNQKVTEVPSKELQVGWNVSILRGENCHPSETCLQGEICSAQSSWVSSRSPSENSDFFGVTVEDWKLSQYHVYCMFPSLLHQTHLQWRFLH